LPFPRRDILLTTVLGGDPDIGGGKESFSMPYVVRGNRHWRFEGVANEFLTSSGRPRQSDLPGVRFHHLVDESARRDKYERDQKLLEAEHERHPDDPRTLFYLAQAYRHMGRPDIAIKHYHRRAQMSSGWDEETFFAQYQVGLLQLETNWPHAVGALLMAWSMRPTRAEPLYYLAYGWRNREAWSAAYLFASRGVHIPEPDDILFVDSAIYRWGLRFERSVAAWYVGERELSHQDTKELLADPELPDPWRQFAHENLRLTS
jgi:tetratricopeptide (TPR) repeat protein